MRSLYAIYRKEMGHYFVSPVAYVVVGVFLSWRVSSSTFTSGSAIQQSFTLQMQSMRFGRRRSSTSPESVMRAFLGFLSTLMLFLVPC